MLARFAGAVALLLVIGVGSVSTANAQSSTQLTIHARVCPNDQIPADFFATCHDDAIADVEFFVNGASAGTTGSDGNLVADVAAGSLELSGGVPGEFARNFIYCSSNADQSVAAAFAEVAAGTAATVTVDSSGTTCDWYVVPFDLSGNDPTPTPVDDDGVTQLPNTGAGGIDGSGGWFRIGGLLAVTALISAFALRRRPI